MLWKHALFYALNTRTYYEILKCQLYNNLSSQTNNKTIFVNVHKLKNPVREGSISLAASSKSKILLPIYSRHVRLSLILLKFLQLLSTAQLQSHHHISSFCYGCMQLPGTKISISYLLLHNKLPQVDQLNKANIISHSFWGSRIWSSLAGLFRRGVSHEVVVKLWTGTSIIWKLKWDCRIHFQALSHRC